MNKANDARKSESRRAIKEKIKVLRRYIEAPPPSGKFIPKSIRQFRDWADPELGLTRIGSAATLNLKQSPHNRDLIEELIRTLEGLARSQKSARRRPAPLQQRLMSAKQEGSDKDLLIAKLVSELHQTHHALKLAESNASSAKQALSNAVETISELRKQLAQQNQSGLRLVEE